MKATTPTTVETPKKERLFSLDLLRGIDMFYLAVGATILSPLLQVWGCKNALRFCCTHPWEGFTLYDMIMPLFIFMSGAAVPLAFQRRLNAEGRPTPEFHRHAWSRFALLWVLGLLAQGGLANYSWHNFSPYNNTLQTIAVGYIVTVYVLLIKSWAIKIAIPILLTLAYGLIVHFGGDYTLAGNVTYPFELKILYAIFPADNVQTQNIVKHGYTWFLPSLMFPVIALCGAYSTLILRSSAGAWRRATWLFAFGLVTEGLGWACEAAGVRSVKHIFTVSFTLQAIGYAILALAVLFVLTDIWKFRKGLGLLMLYGQCALTAYLCEAVFRGACFSVGDRLTIGLQRYVPTGYGPVVSAIAFSIVVTLILLVRKRCRRT